MMWLENEIIEGIQRLLILRLKDAPALDTVDLLADTWICVFKSKAIDWNERLDAPRIRKAFLTCAGNLESWPAPKTVLSHLPSRAEPLKITDSKVYVMPDNIKAIMKAETDTSQHLTDEQRLAKRAKAAEQLELLLNK